jgi:hypothetical protein
MAIEYIGSNTATTTTSALGVSSLPAGTQPGDFLVWIVQAWAATVTSSPAGYSLIRGSDGTSPMYAYGRVATGDSNDLPIALLSTSGNHVAALHAFRGVDPDVPVGQSSAAYMSVASTAHTVGNLEALRDGCMTLCAVATGIANSSYSYNWDAPATKRVDMRSTAGYRYLSTATTEHPTAGLTGTATARFPSSLYNYQARIVLNPKTPSRLRIGSKPIPLMLGNKEIQLMGP